MNIPIGNKTKNGGRYGATAVDYSVGYTVCTKEEYARQTGINVHTVDKMIQQGRIPIFVDEGLKERGG